MVIRNHHLTLPCLRVGTMLRRFPVLGLCKTASFILLVCMFSACSVSSKAPLYSGADMALPSTSVGPGDLHALDGNLVW